MSREKHLRRLKSSLSETQDILSNLAAGTGKDASKRWNKANRKLQGSLEDAGQELEALINESTRDVQKQYARTRKDLNKRAAVAKDQLEDRYADARATARSATRNIRSGAFKSGLGAGALALAAKADLPSRAANVASFLAKTGLAAKAVELATKANLRERTANALEGAASGITSARNRLNPKDRLILQHESESRRISKAGYFARFSVLAIVIISKRHKLMSLARDLYSKIQDKGAREALSQEAKEQFDTMRRLIKAYANGQYREFPYRSLVKIVAAVIYFVSVADLIPDFIPVLGLTDDLAILAWVYTSVKDDLQQFVDWEAAEMKRQDRLNKQSKSTGSDASSGSGVANVGNAGTADRKASPNVSTTTGSDTGSKATVTTGTSNTGSTSGSTTGSSSGSSTTGDVTSAGRTPTSGGSTGSTTGGNKPS